jgi:hypothetical protein
MLNKINWLEVEGKSSLSLFLRSTVQYCQINALFIDIKFSFLLILDASVLSRVSLTLPAIRAKVQLSH